MEQVRHGCATPILKLSKGPHAVRAAIQRSQASLATLSRELGIIPRQLKSGEEGSRRGSEGLQRLGISRLPDIERDRVLLSEVEGPKRQRLKRNPTGFFRMHITEVPTAEGKRYLFVGIERTNKFVVTPLVDKPDRHRAWKFLDHLLKPCPTAATRF